jgi:hypothetical protein
MICIETTNDTNARVYFRLTTRMQHLTFPQVAFYERRGFVLRGTVAIVGSHGEVTMSCLSKSPDQGPLSAK